MLPDRRWAFTGRAGELIAAQVRAELYVSGKLRVNGIELTARLLRSRWVGSEMRNYNP